MSVTALSRVWASLAIDILAPIKIGTRTLSEEEESIHYFKAQKFLFLNIHFYVVKIIFMFARHKKGDGIFQFLFFQNMNLYLFSSLISLILHQFRFICPNPICPNPYFSNTLNSNIFKFQQYLLVTLFFIHLVLS